MILAIVGSFGQPKRFQIRHRCGCEIGSIADRRQQPVRVGTTETRSDPAYWKPSGISGS